MADVKPALTDEELEQGVADCAQVVARCGISAEEAAEAMAEFAGGVPDDLWGVDRNPGGAVG